MSLVQQGKYYGSRFRGLFSCCHTARYLIVIYFQRGPPRANRTVFNSIIFHGLDTRLLTQENEKEKSSVNHDAW